MGATGRVAIHGFHTGEKKKWYYMHHKLGWHLFFKGEKVSVKIEDLTNLTVIPMGKIGAIEGIDAVIDLDSGLVLKGKGVRLDNY